METDNKKILVADDDIFIRNLLKEFLTLHGYNVECVSNGEDAIALIRTRHYTILITDYMMPKINGIELTKMVRNLNLSLPIIGMSAAGDEKEFLASGADLFMAKPFILSAIKNALERKFFISNF